MTILLEKFVEDNYLNINQAYKNVGKNIFGQWQLHDYQVKALKNILTALDFYFEKPSQNQINYLEAKYSNFGPKIINELKINDSDDAFNILKQYYPAKINTTNNAKYIDFKNFINSACFWMATGSGKTLVLIKLIEIMFKLINN